MNKQETKSLDEFLKQIAEIHMNRSTLLGPALKKPLLLLLLIAKIERGEMDQNRLHFSDIRGELTELIQRFGGRPIRSGAKPEQPFCHLRTSPFWNLATQREYPSSETARVSDLMMPGSFASFDSAIYDVLRHSSQGRFQVFQFILDRWWPETLHDEIREQLGMQVPAIVNRPRNAFFVSQVLENYRFSCAFCGFHAVINGRAIGIDACHIHWHSASGPDVSENGIALCKLHHWAFDRGILTLDTEMCIGVASVFVVQSGGSLPLESLAGKSIAVPARETPPATIHLNWHRQNVFLGQ